MSTGPITSLGAPGGNAQGAIYGQLDQLTDASGAISPTTKGTAGSAAFGQTLFTFAPTPMSLTSGYTSPTIATCPSGTNPATLSTYAGLFVTDIYVGSSTATIFPVTIYAGATPIFYGTCKGDTGPSQLSGIETQPMAAPGQALTIVLGTAASTTGYVYLAGFYQ